MHMRRMSIRVLYVTIILIKKEGGFRVKRMGKICGGSKSAFLLFFALRCLATVRPLCFR